MNIFRLQMIIFSLILMATSSFAGVVVQDKDGSTTYFSSGKMKIIDEDMIIIFDVNKSTLTMINNEEKSYSTGTVEEYCSNIKAAKDQAMAQMSAQEKQMLEAFMGGGKKEAPPEVRIEKSGRGEKIAGYPTTLYTVYRNGEKHEELHLSDDVPVFDEVDPVKMSRLSEGFSKCMISAIGLSDNTSVEDDAAYQKLMRKQFPMKNVEFHNGRPENINQVVRMEKQSIPASEFAPPSGYRKMEFQPFLEQSADASGNSSGSESFEGFPMNDDDAAAMAEEEPSMDEEMGLNESSMPLPEQPEEEPQSLEEEIGGQIKEGLKSIFGGF